MEVVAPGAVTCFVHPTTTRADLLLLVVALLLLTTCAVICLKIHQKRQPRSATRQTKYVQLLQPSGVVVSVPAQ